jgi:drug/metabolite transporter (DMT)-like permease
MSAATQLLTGGASLLLVSLALGEHPTWPISSRALGALAYLTLFGSLITFSAFTWLLRNSRPALATSYAYVNPVIAVLAGIALGHEEVSGQFLIASVLIVAGTAFTLLARAAPRSAAELSPVTAAREAP